MRVQTYFQIHIRNLTSIQVQILITIIKLAFWICDLPSLSFILSSLVLIKLVVYQI